LAATKNADTSVEVFARSSPVGLDTANAYKYEIFRLSVHVLIRSWHEPFHAHGIDGGYVVDFLDVKLEARIQRQPKPHLDSITLGYAESALSIVSFAAAASHMGISPQWTATKTSMPVRE